MSDGGIGAAKRVLSLRGVAETEPTGWIGAMDLPAQIEKSVRQTMYGAPLEAAESASLMAFVQQLRPVARPSSAVIDATEAAAIQRGRDLFASLECNRCHAGETMTSEKTYDVGLTDSIGNRMFNPPSLRGIFQRDRFFHDARTTDLREVFRLHAHPRKLNLSEGELDDLVRFLKSQ
jgi:hypothetical protein